MQKKFYSSYPKNRNKLFSDSIFILSPYKDHALILHKNNKTFVKCFRLPFLSYYLFLQHSLKAGAIKHNNDRWGDFLMFSPQLEISPTPTNEFNIIYDSSISLYKVFSTNSQSVYFLYTMLYAYGLPRHFELLIERENSIFLHPSCFQYLKKYCDIPSPNALPVSHNKSVEETLSSLNLPLSKFQIDGIKTMILKDKFLLNDEMGLGKTISALCVFLCRDVLHGLVICPAFLVNKWAEEIHKFNIPIQPVIINRNNLDSLSLPYSRTKTLYIVSYDVSWRLEFIPDFDFLILDESHYIKNIRSKRSKFALSLTEQSKYVLCLSGTPLKNNPVDLFTQLKAVGADLLGIKSPTEFNDYFCAGNKKMLNFIYSNYSIRRVKTDVDVSFPDKTRTLYPIDIKDLSKYKKALAEIKKSTIESNFLLNVAMNNIFYILSQYKIIAVHELVQDLLDNGEKIILFAHHKVILNALYDNYQSTAVLSHSGVSQSDRKKAINKFNTDDKTKIYVGGIKSNNVGIDLAASHIIIYELPPTPADLLQSESRASRMSSQHQKLSIHFPYITGTIEKPLYSRLINKQLDSDIIIDGGRNVEQDLLTLFKDVIFS